MPSGNPLVASVARAHSRLDVVEARLDEHDQKFIRVHLDLATISDVVFRNIAEAAGIRTRRDRQPSKRRRPRKL